MITLLLTCILSPFMSTFKLYLRAILINLCIFAVPVIKAQVNVVTSIRPLQLIAQAIIEDRGQVSSVVGIQDSPHDYLLTPSDRIELERADLLLWIGPEFEIQLTDIYLSLTESKPIITATKLSELSLLNYSSSEIDPHLWLSSSNGIAIAKALSKQLQEIDNANQKQYESSLERFERDINNTHSEILNMIADLQDQQYLVFHSAYEYFRRDYDLERGLALVTNPEVQPSMRELISFRRELKSFSPTCILLERDSNRDLADMALEAREIKIVTSDIQGFQIGGGPSAYNQLLLGVAKSFQSCLSN